MLSTSQPQPTSSAGPDLPRPVDGLHDLVLVPAPGGGLAHPNAPGVALSAVELAGHVGPAADTGGQLRLLVNDGACHEPLLSQVADLLKCDILVTPAGASVDLLAGPDGSPGDAVPVDRSTGDVVEWALVQPASLATTLPGWFDLVGGLVLTRAGLATLPLPKGLEFVDRSSFVERRAAAARLGRGHSDLVTVAVPTRAGRFQLSTFDQDDRADPDGYGGQDLAAALSSIHLYGGDLRLWLSWPQDAAEHNQLETQLAALAEATGATVWAPAAGGAAVLLHGCRDLSSRDRSGNVARWQDYRPPHAREAPRFTTDLDGRLVPTADPAATTIGGVTIVSTRRESAGTLRSRYAGLTAEKGTALLDLTVLADGRLAMSYLDGGHLAVGGGVLRATLASRGWTGEDLLLLTPVAPNALTGLREHLAILEAELGTEFWSLPPGATVVAAAGTARAVDEQGRPTDWLRAGRPAADSIGSRWRNDDGRLVADHQSTAGERTVPIPAPASAAPPPQPVLPPPSPYQVRPASGFGDAHGVPWIPQQPQVNAEPVRMWLSCAWPPGRAAVEGIPTADLFLIGDLDGARVARANPGRYLLCLRVGPGSAIDLSRIDAMPDNLRQQIGDSAGVGSFLLPAAWLGQVQLLAGYRVDTNGRPRDHVELPDEPVLLRCAGAAHGVDGLPNEVVRWPASSREGWVVLPPAPPQGDFVEVHPRRPEVRAGHRLARLRLGAGAAIDVAASAAGLSGLASARSRLPDLLVSGIDVALPPASYQHTRVNQIRYADGTRWRPAPDQVDLPLSALFGSELA
ncbi:hypothetical protein [Phytohabitans kaempferiae]|uniref:Uncharacterized protein n=1 Tax=Phytohabitans kaempferiae TaxID=1620943 RepID=A0ABV6M8V6_9ACTN